jgi:eukaryotic-like serine/threonine-protein kinase
MGPPLRQRDLIRVAAQAIVVALCCAVVAVLLVRARRQTQPQAQAPDKRPPKLVVLEGADWPQFGGGPQHTGRASGRLADSLSLAWSFKTSGAVKSSAAIVEARVYVGSSDANVYALDLQTGSRLWSARLADAADASVCVQEHTVFAGCADGSLYALDANEGSVRWKYETGGQIAGGPNWVRDPKTGGLRVVVGSYDGSLHCVDAKTGKSVWTYKTDNYLNGSPAVDRGLCLAGGCDARIHVVSADDGQATATIDSGSYIAASVAAWEGQAYVGNYNGDFIRVDPGASKIVWRQRVVVGSYDGSLHCVDAKTGKSVWTYKTDNYLNGSPAVDRTPLPGTGRGVRCPHPRGVCR